MAPTKRFPSVTQIFATSCRDPTREETTPKDLLGFLGGRKNTQNFLLVQDPAALLNNMNRK